MCVGGGGGRERLGGKEGITLAVLALEGVGDAQVESASPAVRFQDSSLLCLSSSPAPPLPPIVERS